MVCPERKSIEPIALMAGRADPSGRHRAVGVRVRRGAGVGGVRHGEAGQLIGLLVRRTLEPVPEIKYSASNDNTSTSQEMMAHIKCAHDMSSGVFRGRQELPGHGASTSAGDIGKCGS